MLLLVTNVTEKFWFRISWNFVENTACHKENELPNMLLSWIQTPKDFMLLFKILSKFLILNNMKSLWIFWTEV